MGSSSVGTAAPAGGDAAKAAEAQRRKNEQAHLSAHEHWFAQNYGDRFGITRFSWQEVRGGLTEEERKERAEWEKIKNQPGISTGMHWSPRPLKDGLYHAVDSKYEDWEYIFKGKGKHHGQRFSGSYTQNMFINVENGVATPKPPLRESEFASHPDLYMKKFRAQYGQIFDFMAVNRGLSSVQIDFPDISMGPTMSAHDTERLNAMLEEAEKRGLKVDFGPKIKDWLELHKTAFFDYNKKLDDMNARVDAENAKKPGWAERDADIQKIEYNHLANDLNKPKKLDGADYDAKKGGMKKEIEDALKEKPGVEQLKIMEDRITTVEDRVATLNTAYDRAVSDLEVAEKRIEGAKTTEELDAIEASVKALDDRREELGKAMKSEREDLVAVRDALAEHPIPAIKHDEVAPGATPLKDDEKAANEKRKTAITDRVTAVENKLKKTGDNNIEKVQTERRIELNRKIEEKRNNVLSPPAPTT